MSNQHTTCSKCGQQAMIVEVDGLLYPDPHWPGTRVIEVINCSQCGIIEQPEQRNPKPVVSDTAKDIQLVVKTLIHELDVVPH